MKIVHITNFYSSKSGGIKTTLHELGSRYREFGHEFFFIIPGQRYSVDVVACGVQISMPSIPIPFSGGYRIIRSNGSIKRVLQTIRPDRIEVSDRVSLRGIGTWASRRKICTVVFSHESLSELVRRFFRFESLQRIVDWHNRRLSKSFDWVVACTDYAAKEFRKIDTPNLKKIPLGVDLETFQPLRRNADIRSKLLQGQELLLVHCGRLSVEKNPAVSLNVLKNLVEKGVKARLVYIGMGPLFEKLQRNAVGYPVTFLGYVVGPQKVAGILASADVVLAPGPHETFCLAALESLSCGTPVIASNSSAVVEILTDEDGLMCGRTCGENLETWVDAVMEVSSQPGLRQRCRSRAEKFSWVNTVHDLLATSKELAA
jgi:alpha-1,6-mannosyltransferase